MNSSTKAPPAQAHKFQFGTDFEQEAERLRADTVLHPSEELRHEEEIIPQAPPAPSFSEEDLAAAQQEAFSKGLEQGSEEARNAVESNLTTLVTMVMTSLERLVGAEDKRLQDMQELVLRTTIATLKKIWPTIVQGQALAIVENTIRQSLEYNPEETRIVIRVHDTMLDPLIQRLPQLQAQQAFAGKVIVLADANVGPGDCKVEWADGGMERLSRHVSAQIDQALDRALASLSSNSKNADTERSST